METTELALYPQLRHTQHYLAATLEMAAEAEMLNRFPQARLLYSRALIIAEATFDEDHAQAVSILWDLARVSEKENKPRDAEHYYNRLIAIGFCCRQQPVNKAA